MHVLCVGYILKQLNFYSRPIIVYCYFRSFIMIMIISSTIIGFIICIIVSPCNIEKGIKDNERTGRVILHYRIYLDIGTAYVLISLLQERSVLSLYQIFIICHRFKSVAYYCLSLSANDLISVVSLVYTA